MKLLLCGRLQHQPDQIRVGYIQYTDILTSVYRLCSKHLSVTSSRENAQSVLLFAAIEDERSSLFSFFS